ADPAEATDVAEQDGDLAVAAVEQVGVVEQLPGQLGGEELLHLHASGDGLALLLEASEPGGDAAGQQLHEPRLRLAEGGDAGAKALAALAVEGAEDGAGAVEDRRRHHRLDAGEALGVLSARGEHLPGGAA